MPDDFDQYFGTLCEGTDSNDRIRLGRQGYMYFIDNGATSLERGVSTWSNNFPSMPYWALGSRPGTIAPLVGLLHLLLLLRQHGDRLQRPLPALQRQGGH